MKKNMVSLAVLGTVTALAPNLPAYSKTTVATADGMTPRGIMEKNFFSTKIHLLKTQSTMTLINGAGEKRVRKMTTYTKLQPNGVNSDLLIKFTYPEDISGTSYLQIQHGVRPDDEWIYIPALHQSRRLIADDKSDSFVGSDFSYDDLTLPAVDKFKYKELGTTKINGKPCFIIESIPSTKQVEQISGYSKKVSWIEKNNYVALKIEYYDTNGELLKTQEISGYQLVEPKDDRWFPQKRIMTNDQTGHKTIIAFHKISSGIPIPSWTFTTHYMEGE